GAAPDDGAGDLVRERSGLGAGTLRVRENVEISKRERFDEGQSGSVVIFGLAGKAGDDVGADGGVREALADEFDAARVVLGAVPAVHGCQDAIRAGLQRHVEVLREALGRGKKLGEIARYVHWLYRGCAQALDGRFVQDPPKQVFEFDARRELAAVSA